MPTARRARVSGKPPYTANAPAKARTTTPSDLWLPGRQQSSAPARIHPAHAIGLLTAHPAHPLNEPDNMKVVPASAAPRGRAPKRRAAT